MKKKEMRLEEQGGKAPSQENEKKERNVREKRSERDG